MPTVVGILTFISMINTQSDSFKATLKEGMDMNKG